MTTKRKVKLDGIEYSGGTIVTFYGEMPTGDRVLVHVDHRPARPIVEALAAGEDVVVYPEPWQIETDTDGRG